MLYISKFKKHGNKGEKEEIDKKKTHFAPRIIRKGILA